MKVLFANLPWYSPPSPEAAGWRGVRAGSRWPHTFPYYVHEPEGGFVKDMVGGYMPFPFWLATASAWAKKEGFDSVCRDSIAEGETYEHFYQFFSEISPDVVVVETATATLENDLDVITQLKEINPKLTVILVGLHSKLEEPEFLAEHSEVDFVAYGEYEWSVLQILKKIQSDNTDFHEVGGIVYRSPFKIQKMPFSDLPDLNDYPWADRSDLPNSHYFDTVCGLEKPQLQVMSTRGCPYGCIFCVWPQMFYKGKSYRKRSPKDVVEEIAYHFKNGNYKSFYIDDDTFNISRNHVIEMCQEILAHGLNKYPWGTMGRADLVDEEVVDWLIKAGLFSIKYGVESSDQNILDEIDKRIHFDKLVNGIMITKAAGIQVHLTYTFGLPSDTVETIEKTIDMACTLPADSAQFSIATPYPGTKMYEMYKERNWLISDRNADFVGSTTAVSRTDTLQPEQLEYYIAEAYRRFHDALIARNVGTEDFVRKFASHVKEQVPNGSKIAIIQCARIALTRHLVGHLCDLGYEPHVISHPRFKEHFESKLSEYQIHLFKNSTDFKFDRLSSYFEEVGKVHDFGGTIIPYSNSSGGGYQEVTALASLLGCKVIAGVTFDGRILS